MTRDKNAWLALEAAMNLCASSVVAVGVANALAFAVKPLQEGPMRNSMRKSNKNNPLAPGKTLRQLAY